MKDNGKSNSSFYMTTVWITTALKLFVGLSSSYKGYSN